jgi:hypothetical protein
VIKDPSCTAVEAVVRAQEALKMGGTYILGTGDYWPHKEADELVDTPFTWKQGKWGTDCAGFAVCYAWKLRRHRPGFNKGRWATVSDDINTDSIYEDATHKKELGELVKTPRPGDLLLYPSYRRNGVRILIGHVGLIERVPAEWDEADPTPPYEQLTILQSFGPTGRKPAVKRTDGSIWARHDELWKRHPSVIVRLKERNQSE